jgi:histidinol phosphatase-like PHP family hydrolase
LPATQSALAAAYAERDFHVHTFFSPCSHDEGNTIPNIVKAAAERGIEQLALTDHWYEARRGYKPPKFYRIVDQTIYERTRAAVASLDTEVEVLVACEVDMPRPGVFNGSEQLARQLDYVLVTASHFHLGDVEQPPSRDPRTLAEHGLKFLRAAIEWPPTQVVAHPICGFWAKGCDLADVVDTITDEELLEVLSLARDNDVALEMNRTLFGQSERRDAAQLRFFRLVKQAGCKVSPGSDTHTLAGIGSTAGLTPYAQRAGLTAEDIIDAEWLRTHRGE